ncbi:DUF551 domain-containing protein [Klebsiella pneumoniae]|nr:DUF551 domain-containing protein [Klebsiella pneumoniae]ELT5797164.1 DUF551 domain-containing protein [Klebsiella pneumoniae]
MTKSTITREQLLEIIETDHVQCGEASYLASMALAAMDSEPVAWLRNPDQGFHLPMLRLGSKDPNPNFVNEEFYPVYAAPQPVPVVLDAVDTNLIEALRLVQCMLDDYRERNYGDAQGWIRHINTHMSDYTEAHGDDAYSVLHNLITAAPQSPGSEPAPVPGKWIPVSERMPEEGGRYWCYVEEQNSLGKSHYQWNCSWNGDVWSDKALTGRVTHWMPLPAGPQEVR